MLLKTCFWWGKAVMSFFFSVIGDKHMELITPFYLPFLMLEISHHLQWKGHIRHTIAILYNHLRWFDKEWFNISHNVYKRLSNSAPYLNTVQTKKSQNAVFPCAITYKMESVWVKYFQEGINHLILNGVPSVTELRKVKPYPMPANTVLQVLRKGLVWNMQFSRNTTCMWKYVDCK